MSSHTQSLLGQPRNLAMALGTAAGSADYHVWRVMTLPDGLLVGAQPDSDRDEEKELSQLRDHFLLHYFRLEQLERRLARRRRGAASTRQMRQIEDERKRLGQELHTGVGQLLAAIRIQLEVIAKHLANTPEIVRAALARIEELVGEAFQQVRGTSQRIYLPDWAQLPLEEALKRLWDMSGVAARYAAELNMPPLPAQPDLDVKTAVYRAAQEALSNLARHSRATQVRMSLVAEGGWLVLNVFNDMEGRATEPAAPAKPTWGIGLRSIRDQAQALGGNMELRRTAEGVTLTVRVPIAGGEQDAATHDFE